MTSGLTRGLLSCALACTLGLLAGRARARPERGAAGETARRRVTFTRDVAPIVLRSCAPCHRPGEVGPFSLLTFQDVRKRARQIAAVTGRRYMPPWLPEAGFGEFAGERRLSGDEIETIAEWVRQGAPQGAASDLPPPPPATAGWPLGQPDLIVAMREAYTLPADGTDVFRNFVIPVPPRAPAT